MNSNGIAEETSIVHEVVKKRTERKIDRAKVRNDNGTIVMDDYFRLHEGTYNILKRNVEKGVNTLILGKTGVGKTEMVDCLARVMDLPLTIFDMGTMTDPIMSLVGTHAIKVKEGKSESRFIASRFSEVIQHPGIVLMDEISRSSIQANNLLFPVLDFRRTLSMEYSFDNHAPVKVHPKCVFFSTANLGSQYTGTHRLDRALVDRFMMIEIDSLDKVETDQILKYHFPIVSYDQRTKIVNTYEKINKTYEDNGVSFDLSLRHLKMITELVQDGFTIYDSFYAVCKGIGSKEGLKSLEAILNESR